MRAANEGQRKQEREEENVVPFIYEYSNQMFFTLLVFFLFNGGPDLAQGLKRGRILMAFGGLIG